MIKFAPNDNVQRLQDKVILIINGLCESGRVLAKMIARQGSDVVIVDLQADPELTQRIRDDVAATGHRCLIITPDMFASVSRTFPQDVIQEINATFGRLDAFISYSARDGSGSGVSETAANGDRQKLRLFGREGLTKAALDYILCQPPASAISHLENN